MKKPPHRKHWRRRKGKKLQNYVQSLIRKTFPHLKKKDVDVAGDGISGPDIILSDTGKRLCPYLFETKNQNKMKTVYDFYNQASKNADLSSRSMIISGGLVLVFLVLHLRDYFYELKFIGLPEGDTDYDLVVKLFSDPIYTGFYVVSFILLGFHLNHGFKSAFQSVGANHKKYNNTIKIAGTLYSIFIALGFSAIAIVHFINQYPFK